MGAYGLWVKDATGIAAESGVAAPVKARPLRRVGARRFTVAATERSFWGALQSVSQGKPNVDLPGYFNGAHF